MIIIYTLMLAEIEIILQWGHCSLTHDTTVDQAPCMQNTAIEHCFPSCQTKYFRHNTDHKGKKDSGKGMYSSIQHLIKPPIQKKIYAKVLNLCKDSLETGLDSRGVSTLHLLLALTTLVEVEGGHGRDAVGSSDLGELVNVDLVELDVGVGLAHLLDGGGDGLAGAAPHGVEVDDDGTGGIGDLLLVLGGAGRC